MSNWTALVHFNPPPFSAGKLRCHLPCLKIRDMFRSQCELVLVMLILMQPAMAWAHPGHPMTSQGIGHLLTHWDHVAVLALMIVAIGRMGVVRISNEIARRRSENSSPDRI